MLRLSFLRITFTFHFFRVSAALQELSFVRHFSRTLMQTNPFYWFINLLHPSTFSYQEEKSIITVIQSVTIQTYFNDENALRKNQYLLQNSLLHYRALHCTAFICHLQSQHPVSTFRFGLMKTLPAIPNMLVSPKDFSAGPVGRGIGKNHLSFLKSYRKYKRMSGIFVSCTLFSILCMRAAKALTRLRICTCLS